MPKQRGRRRRDARPAPKPRGTAATWSGPCSYCRGWIAPPMRVVKHGASWVHFACSEADRNRRMIDAGRGGW